MVPPRTSVQRGNCRTSEAVQVVLAKSDIALNRLESVCKIAAFARALPWVVVYVDYVLALFDPWH